MVTGEPEDEALLFKVVDLLLREQKSVQEIGGEVGLSRQAIYPLIVKAYEHGLLRVCAPIARELGRELAARFRCPPGSITVVTTAFRPRGDPPGRNMDTHAKGLGSYVAAAAADRVAEILGELGRVKTGPIGMGLGPGRATLDFCRHMSRRMSDVPGLPTVNLFAIAAAAPADTPEVAATSFFNLFPSDAAKDKLGLFAETLVKARDIPDIVKRPGVKEAMARKGEIDVIVTAMGDFNDQHDLLRTFLSDAGVNIKSKQSAGYHGNVQYRPYTELGPVAEDRNDFRAVTLFELDEFVRLANTRNKHVILIARCCAICGESRARALRPLLTQESLKVWSELFLDFKTANDLLLTA